MSIKSRQREVEVLKPLETATTLETKTEYETDRKVHMAISLLSGTTANTNNTIFFAVIGNIGKCLVLS